MNFHKNQDFLQPPIKVSIGVGELIKITIMTGGNMMSNHDDGDGKGDDDDWVHPCAEVILQTLAQKFQCAQIWIFTMVRYNNEDGDDDGS